jgi:hypothetical protein
MMLGANTTTYGGEEGASSALSGIPRWYVPEFGKDNLDINEIGDVRDLWDATDVALNEATRQYGQFEVDYPYAIKVQGQKDKVPQRIIDAAIFFNKQENQDKYTNPEWLDFVAEHEDILRQEDPKLFNRSIEAYLNFLKGSK